MPKSKLLPFINSVLFLNQYLIFINFTSIESNQ